MKWLIVVIALGVLALGFVMFRFTFKLTKKMFRGTFKLISWSYKGTVKLIKFGYKGTVKLIKWMVKGFKQIPGLEGKDKWHDLKHKLEQVKKIS